MHVSQIRVSGYVVWNSDTCYVLPQPVLNNDLKMRLIQTLIHIIWKQVHGFMTIV